MKSLTQQTLHTLIVCFSLLLLNSCDLKDEAEKIPAFIAIDSVAFTTDISTQGSNSQSITEAWLYVEGRLQGIYDLPMNVPILAEGTKDIFVLAGIKRDGASNTRIDYPFYIPFRDTVTFKALDTIKLKPTFRYYDNLNIWFESFEEAGTKLVKTSDSDTGIFVTNNKNEVFEGNGSGKISLGTTKKSALLNTTQKFKLPKGMPVFLEIDYKTNQDLILGLVSRFPNTSSPDVFTEVIYLVPTNSKLNNGWKKAYINLSTKISQQANFSDFDFYIHLRRDGSIAEPEAIIDNVKLVYRK